MLFQRIGWGNEKDSHCSDCHALSLDAVLHMTDYLGQVIRAEGRQCGGEMVATTQGKLSENEIRGHPDDSPFS